MPCATKTPAKESTKDPAKTPGRPVSAGAGLTSSGSAPSRASVPRVPLGQPWGGVSDSIGVETMSVAQSGHSAPPPSPSTPWSRRLPRPELDESLLIEALADLAAGPRTEPKASLEVFIGTSPISHQSVRRSRAQKENTAP